MFNSKTDRRWTVSKKAGTWEGCRSPQQIRERGAKLWAKTPHEFLDLMNGNRLTPYEKAVVIALVDQLYRFGNGRTDTRCFVVATRKQIGAAAGVCSNKVRDALQAMQNARVLQVEDVGRGYFRIGFCYQTPKTDGKPVPW